MPLYRLTCPQCDYWVEADPSLVNGRGAPYCPHHAAALRGVPESSQRADDEPSRPGKPEIYHVDGAFRLDLLNASMDLEALAAAVLQVDATDGLRLLLSGAPGTGKSEFARFLAGQMKCPAQVVSYGDLVSHFVGQTEKQIAKVLTEAQQNGQFLILDEADSFLRSRTNAYHNWEVTQVNEFLQQLDRTTTPIAFTTNDVAAIDSAVMRRIDLKITFYPLGKERMRVAFNHYFQQPAPSSLDHLGEEEIALGDFRAVARRARLLGHTNDPEWLVSELELEASYKPDAGRRRNAIGFQLSNRADAS